MLRGVTHICYQIIDVSKIFLILSLVCFAPQFLFREKKKTFSSIDNISTDGNFKPAHEVISLAYLMQLSGRSNPSIGLMLQHPEKYRDILNRLKQKDISVVKIMYQNLQNTQGEAGENHEMFDGIQAYPITTSSLDDTLVEGLDLLLVDFQDIGLGHAPSVSLLFQTLIASVVHKIPVVVLDRPNLLGNKIEGALFSSSLVQSGIPFRYGMTLGELARYYNAEVLDYAADLHVVPMQNYRREIVKINLCESQFSSSADLQAFWGLSICSLLSDVAPFDIGIHTPYAYRCITLPKSVPFSEQRWYQLKIMLHGFGIKTSACSYFSPQKKEHCRGLRLHFNETDKIDSFAVLVKILTFFKHAGIVLGFSSSFDEKIGTPLVREYVQGSISKDQLAHVVNGGLEDFYRKAFGSFMYHPLPQLVLL